MIRVGVSSLADLASKMTLMPPFSIKEISKNSKLSKSLQVDITEMFFLRLTILSLTNPDEPEEPMKPVNLVCPICKGKKTIKVPESVIKESKQLTTISIPKGLVCDHHFQAFIDKKFIPRGYQKVDFTINK